MGWRRGGERGRKGREGEGTYAQELYTLGTFVDGMSGGVFVLHSDADGNLLASVGVIVVLEPGFIDSQSKATSNSSSSHNLSSVFVSS